MTVFSSNIHQQASKIRLHTHIHVPKQFPDEYFLFNNVSVRENKQNQKISSAAYVFIMPYAKQTFVLNTIQLQLKNIHTFTFPPFTSIDKLNQCRQPSPHATFKHLTVKPKLVRFCELSPTRRYSPSIEQYLQTASIKP